MLERIGGSYIEREITLVSGIQRVRDLEISQDLDFQRNSWTVERVGWVVMTLVVIAALLGLLGGDGPLATATAGDDIDPLQVHYRRFLRKHSPTQFQIDLQPGAVQGEEARIWIDREFLEGYEIRNIVPEPDSVEAGADRMIYVFTLDQASQPTTISFNVQAQQIGPAMGRVGLDGGQDVEFSQLVYP